MNSVLIIGTGPVGRALAAGLSRAGLEVRHFSRSAGWLRGGPGAAAEVAVLAVRDEAIADAAEAALAQGRAGPASVLLHCAGALPPEDVLGTVRGRVRGIGLLHPLRALAQGVDDLCGTVMALCGDGPGLAAAQALAQALGGVPLPLRPEQLGAYHAAAVMVAGHFMALLDVASGVLAGAGLDRGHATQALAALSRSALDNLDQVGLPAAVTGPIARGNTDTVARHLRALDPAAAAVYRALAPHVLRLARDKGAAPAAALSQIASLLNLPPDLS